MSNMLTCCYRGRYLTLDTPTRPISAHPGIHSVKTLTLTLSYSTPCLPSVVSLRRSQLLYLLTSVDLNLNYITIKLNELSPHHTIPLFTFIPFQTNPISTQASCRESVSLTPFKFLSSCQTFQFLTCMLAQSSANQSTLLLTLLNL